MAKKTGKRWKPKEFEKIVSLYKSPGMMRFRALEDVWVNSLRDKENYKSGNCFRTKREASAKCKEINAAIKRILKEK